MYKKVKITLIKSKIHQKPKKRATLRCLGLKKINSQVLHDASPSILGMIKSVQHLVDVKELV